MRPQTDTHTIRLDRETLALIEEHRDRLVARVAPLKVTRADAYRDLIMRGIAAVTKEETARRPRA